MENKLENLINGKKFNSDQLDQIRIGLEEDGLNPEQVKIYLDPDFDRFQMAAIRIGLCDGQDVSIFAKKAFSGSQMGHISLALKKGLDADIIGYIANPKFTGPQIRELTNWATAGFSLEVIKSFAERDFSDEQLEQIRKALKDGLDTTLLADPEFSPEQMSIIQNCLHDVKAGCGRMSLEGIKIFAHPEFNADQMDAIAESIYCEVPLDYIKIFAQPGISANQMDVIRCACSKGVKEDLIKYMAELAQKGISWQRLTWLTEDIVNGVPKNIFDIYLDISLEDICALEIRAMLLHGKEKEVKEYIDRYISKGIIPHAEKIYPYIKNKSLNYTDIFKIMSLVKDDEDPHFINEIVSILSKDLDQNHLFLLNRMLENEDDLKDIKESFLDVEEKDLKDQEVEKFYNIVKGKNLNYMQLERILISLKNNVADPIVKFIADSKYSPIMQRCISSNASYYNVTDEAGLKQIAKDCSENVQEEEEEK